jgi:hypothetical protein
MGLPEYTNIFYLGIQKTKGNLQLTNEISHLGQCFYIISNNTQSVFFGQVVWTFGLSLFCLLAYTSS